MLRKTVARAFGSSEAGAVEFAPALHETRRDHALERLYRDLLQAFEAETHEEPQGSGHAAPAEGFDLAGPSRVSLTRPRPKAGGFEFTVEGPAGAFTFLNSLAGYVAVFAGSSSEGGAPLEVLSVQLQGGAFRPIRKPFGGGGSGPSPAVRRRMAFRFSSVPEVACDYLARAKSINKIDTARGVS